MMKRRGRRFPATDRHARIDPAGAPARLGCKDGFAAAGARPVPPRGACQDGRAVAPDLLDRNAAAIRPDTVWLADISYIATGEGWLYLAAVRDMATREIIGWSMADHLGADLACDALRAALQRRPPPEGLIHHSDRGVQYADTAYQHILRRHGLRCSMSRRGSCHDNVPMAGFFGSLKAGLTHRFPTREAARRALFDYIELFYNHRRRHAGPRFLTPAQAHGR